MSIRNLSRRLIRVRQRILHKADWKVSRLKIQTHQRPKKRNEKKKDKQCVHCSCCFTSRDRNMLFCGDSHKWQHSICYQIFGPVQLPHRCGPCSVRLNLACTSQQIKDFCLKRNKTEQERQEFVLMLLLRRIIDSFLAGEHLGYNFTVNPSEGFLIVQFEVSSQMFYSFEKC